MTEEKQTTNETEAAQPEESQPTDSQGPGIGKAEPPPELDEDAIGVGRTPKNCRSSSEFGRLEKSRGPNKSRTGGAGARSRTRMRALAHK